MSVNWFGQLKESAWDQTRHDCQQPQFLPIVKYGLDHFIHAEIQ